MMESGRPPISDKNRIMLLVGGAAGVGGASHRLSHEWDNLASRGRGDICLV